MIIISACLCGVNCKYNGKNNLKEGVEKLLKEGKLIPVCPEQLGGMETPREPHEIVDSTALEVLRGKGKVLSITYKDSTDKFIKGAYETLRMAKDLGVTEAILKSNSPSCGFGTIYDGNFSGNKIKGNGVTAELLKRENIKIYNEEYIERLLEE
ncbi:hypothetical protein K144313037_20410 [Clostridium tetani]|uniref:DUF523 domain-containing protein n=1 Tax=Clostridium tetani TaxID=1513 RepID=A0ABC8EGD1_CLOTA|nr:DUF523 domain-containing protein [Clostridium tetani]BDR68016.1 hypothetical protein K144312032_22440 [Clostridium tetani]BDR70629.1 hypothetical protein K144313037_20410 [Clostridium tetani]BDR73495.1 hypothetical protein K144316041_22030 [Clostridium tetani]BDR81935.1 hypothetical protein K234311028_21810 [Clostridium tetani]BDR90320.1 hypothetical protein N072000002_21210 [Clostridium tetani]